MKEEWNKLNLFFPVLVLIICCSFAISCSEKAEKGIRFDGLYVSTSPGANYFLRFFPDGRVVQLGGNLFDPKNIAETLNWQVCASRGTYTVSENSLTFYTISEPDGVEVDYKGQIKGSSLELISISQANKHKSTEVYEFQKHEVREDVFEPEQYITVVINYIGAEHPTRYDILNKRKILVSRITKSWDLKELKVVRKIIAYGQPLDESFPEGVNPKDIFYDSGGVDKKEPVEFASVCFDKDGNLLVEENKPVVKKTFSIDFSTKLVFADQRSGLKKRVVYHVFSCANCQKETSNEHCVFALW